MTNLSCITITTLIVVSLANLILLVTVILASRRTCEDVPYEISERTGNYPESRLLTLVEAKNQNFMAALCLLKYNRMLLVCGTTIISKFWVITTAHCCVNVQDYQLEKLKITSNSIKWKSGIPHDLDKIIIHEKFSPNTVTHNVCIIQVRTPFGERFDSSMLLASSKYHYKSNTTAVTMGWISEGVPGQRDQQLFSLDVALVPHDLCKKLHKNSVIDSTMVCAQTGDKRKVCNLDSGGPLLQKNVVIGLVSFETDCASGDYPRVYTRIGYFENWFKQLEKLNKIKIGAKFKS